MTSSIPMDRYKKDFDAIKEPKPKVEVDWRKSVINLSQLTLD